MEWNTLFNRNIEIFPENIHTVEVLFLLQLLLFLGWFYSNYLYTKNPQSRNGWGFFVWEVMVPVRNWKCFTFGRYLFSTTFTPNPQLVSIVEVKRGEFYEKAYNIVSSHGKKISYIKNQVNWSIRMCSIWIAICPLCRYFFKKL